MFKVNKKTPKRRNLCRFGVFIVNFEHISHFFLVLLLLTLNLVNIYKTQDQFTTRLFIIKNLNVA